MKGVRIAFRGAIVLLSVSPSLAQKVGDGFGDGFGTCVARVDDLDCDGVADLAVGAPYSKRPADILDFTPRVFLFSSRTGVLIRERASVSKERIGFDVERARDIDGDGFDEIVSGRIVFSGSDGREILTPRAEPPPWGSVMLLAPSASTGESKAAEIGRLFHSPADVQDHRVLEAAFELVGPRVDMLGRVGWWRSVASPSPSGAATSSLRLTVEHVMPESNMVGCATLVFRSPNPQATLVYSGDCELRDFAKTIAWIGDVDQDGTADFAISDFWYTYASTYSVEPCDGGRVFIHSGRTGALLRTLGERDHPEFGYAIAGGEDLDGDRVPDLLLGTSTFGGGEIEAYSGASGRRIFGIQDRGRDDCLGVSVAFLDDVDGDGVCDFAAGSVWVLDVNTWGEAIVYSGRTRAVLYRVHSPYLPG